MFDHDDTANRRVFLRRLLVAGGVSSLTFAAVSLRFFDLQIRNGGRYAPLAEDNRIALSILAPKRGRILDRLGREIVGNRETFRATLVPSLAGDVPHVLKLFEALVPLDEAARKRIKQRLQRQRRNDAVMLVGNLTFEQVAKINVSAPYLPGVNTDVVWKRDYQSGPELGQIVGYVGYPREDDAAADPLLRLPGMRVGKSGIEAGLNRSLLGRGGTQRVEVDARGSIIRDLGVNPPVDGSDVTLTLDSSLQSRLYALMKPFGRASCVVMQIASGQVVAMCSAPSYDPKAIVDGMSEAEWEALAESPDKPLINRATAGLYEPGRLFHAVTALAALGAQVVRPAEVMHCPGHYDLNGVRHHCGPQPSGHGTLNLRDALNVGCAHYFSELSRRTGARAIARVARQLGFGARHMIGMSPQLSGTIADEAALAPESSVQARDDATRALGLGLGDTKVTPLQIALFLARVASGKVVRPRIAVLDNKRPSDLVAGTRFSELDVAGDDLKVLHAALMGEGSATSGFVSGPYHSDGTAVAHAPAPGASNTPAEDESVVASDAALFFGYSPGREPHYAVAAVVEGGIHTAAAVRQIAEAAVAMTIETYQSGSEPTMSMDRG